MAETDVGFFEAATSLRVWPIQAQLTLQSLGERDGSREVSPTTSLSCSPSPSSSWGIYCQCTLYSAQKQIATRYRGHTQSAMPDLTWRSPGQESAVNFPLTGEIEELEITCYAGPTNHNSSRGRREKKSSRRIIGTAILSPPHIQHFEYQSIQTLPLYRWEPRPNESPNENIEEFAGELTLRIEFAMLPNYLLSVFPDEILYHIFSYLDWNSLCQVRLVRRRWDYLSRDRGLLLSMARWAIKKREYRDAVPFYHRAIQEGDTTSMNELGRLYQHKLSSTLDPQHTKAFVWYKQAVDAGCISGLNDLGWCYEKGLGCDIDTAKAAQYYLEAAQQGDVSGQNNIGWCYQKGIGVPKDYAEAFRWYSQAASHGHSSGYNNMAWCYHQGIGVEQDYQKALQAYLKAATLGNKYAQNTVGNMYYYGQGIAKNLDQALYWIQKAAGQGHLTAKKALPTLQEEFDRANTTINQ